MSLLQRYQRVNFWGKFSVWGSISSIIPFGVWIWSLFQPAATPSGVASQPAPSTVVASSPGATTMQAGRDIVINNPTAAKVEPANPSPREASVSKTPAAKAPIQTMINSPGGIQAGGSVTINAERRIINSIVLRVILEATTSATTPSDPGTDAGVGGPLALFTDDKTRIQFDTNGTLRDHQETETIRRLTLTYSPETPEDILGKPVEFLSSINVMAINYAELFKLMKLDTSVTKMVLDCIIFVNGIPAGNIKGDFQPGLLAKGQVTFNVADSFDKVTDRYDAAVARK